MAIGFTAWPSKKAEACCSCEDSVQETSDAEWSETTPTVNDHTTNQFIAYRTWHVSTLFEDNILPAMQMMAEQLSAVAMQQVAIIGTFFDAKHQMETQQVFQKLQARAHKDYHPSVGMCEFGSNAKSLAASERKSEFNAIVMSQRSQDRALGNAYTASATGESDDKKHRIRQFRKTFCDPMDNNNGLTFLCDHDQKYGEGDVGAEDPKRMNKDIDFARTVAAPWTLDIDFTDSDLTDNEEEVLALASNLYGHNVFKRPPPTSLENRPGSIAPMQKFYMDARSILAKRSVAENSFNAITAMKSRGAPGSREFMLAVLQELGASDVDAAALLGDYKDGSDDVEVDPSYYAQMEVLTKKIFQNPDFYTNLYDKPANVDRKNVALQAVGLMQKFDLFKSYLRNEASLSVLLELAVMDLQEEMESQVARMKAGGTPAEE